MNVKRLHLDPFQSLFCLVVFKCKPFSNNPLFLLSGRQRPLTHNTLHMLRSDEPLGGGMMSLLTNNNHPASRLSSLPQRRMATGQLSPHGLLHGPQCLVNHLPFRAIVMDPITMPSHQPQHPFAFSNHTFSR